ncbi:hypothetical protein ACJIZ3_017310 [Penstemon smallii]|uniref:Uncharacterized protein n=1 Tax=Penstemon smallii TaxID=265156 RepID=A0ABD3SWB8_9LAMI
MFIIIMEEPQISLKLLINSQREEVIYAEAGKDCVDFLFHILSLPIASVIRLLRENGMVGTVQNLYESVKNLDETYILPQHGKTSILTPKSRACDCSVPLLQLSTSPNEKTFYKCSDYRHSNVRCITDDPRATCPSCFKEMTTSVTFVAPPLPENATNEAGVVKGVVSYMVMDDLVVKPMSTLSILTLLKEFNVRDVSVLQEKVVNLGTNEALNLLKASFYSKKVLTEVFLTTSLHKRFAFLLTEPLADDDDMDPDYHEDDYDDDDDDYADDDYDDNDDDEDDRMTMNLKKLIVT